MGLDHLSNVYNDEILPLFMPVVEARLADAEWRKRESAILALGAVRWGGGLGWLAGVGWGAGGRGRRGSAYMDVSGCLFV
jgi:hypothetical protein